MSDRLWPRGCTQLRSGAAGEGRAWKLGGLVEGKREEPASGGGLLAGLGELVDWERACAWLGGCQQWLWQT